MCDLSICCNLPTIKVEGTIVCGNCYNLLDDLVFEESYLEFGNSNKLRYNKFLDLILKSGVPWYCRETLLDFFNQIENYFFTSKRKNFINLHQLAIELCKQAGYPECAIYFTPMKTKVRVKQVEKFVQDGLKANLHYKGNITRIKDMEFLSIGSNQTSDNSTKVFNDNHIYIDFHANKNCQTIRTKKT